MVTLEKGALSTLALDRIRRRSLLHCIVGRTEPRWEVLLRLDQTQKIASLTEEIASLNMLVEERAREARLIHELAVVEEKRHLRAERQWANPERQIADLEARLEKQLQSAQADAEIARANAVAAREEAAEEARFIRPSGANVYASCNHEIN